MIRQDEKLYTLGEIYEELNECRYKDFHLHNKKYIQKVFNDIFNIKGTEYLNRVYTKSDLDKLNKILNSKDQESNYGYINSMPVNMQAVENEDEDSEYAEDRVSNLQIIEEKSIVTGPSIEDLKEFMVQIVSSSLQSTVVPELQDMKKDLVDLKLHNMDLKVSLEKQQEKHFREIDSKLTKWREETFNRKTPWYKKLFK